MKSALLIFTCFISLTIPAQTARINELKKSLSTLNTAKRVDCLNAIAKEFLLQFIRSDSSLKYSKQAFNEASAINYKPGQGLSLILQAEVYGRLLRNLDAMEESCKKAIKLLSGTKDWKNFSHAHCLLALASVWRGKYDQIQSLLDKAKNISVANNDIYGIGWYNLVKGLSFN